MVPELDYYEDSPLFKRSSSEILSQNEGNTPSLVRHIDFVHDAFSRQALINEGSLTETSLRTILTPVIFAGCGSTGFAASEGIKRNAAPFTMIFLDPDKYDISNLPRQTINIDQLSRNKARASAERANDLLPYAQTLYGEKGVDENITLILDDVSNYCDELNRYFSDYLLRPIKPVVFDSIDVTTTGGWDARFRLHEELSVRGFRAFGAYDLGHSSLIFDFPYDARVMEPFRGKIKKGVNFTPQDYNMGLMPKYGWVIPKVPLDYAYQYIERAKRIVDSERSEIFVPSQIPSMPQERTAGSLFEAMAPILLKKFIQREGIPEYQHMFVENPARLDKLRMIFLFLSNRLLIREAGVIEAKYKS